MSFRLNISPAVKQELAEAYGWYAERSEKAAEAFRDEVLDAFDLVVRHPDRFPLWDSLVRRFVLKHYPYSIYYSVGDRVVNILAVGHNRRSAGYWLKR
jgi:plasmid stabilization system protein ParE